MPRGEGPNRSLAVALHLEEKGLKALGRRWMAGVAPAGVLAFWAGMMMAAQRYPSEYDWRYMTISSLVYPDRNPVGHLWASGGIFLCGLCGLWCAVVLARDRNSAAAAGGTAGVRALALGSFCMACSGLLPERLLPVPKGHEVLALTAFLSLCVGIVRMTFRAVATRLRPAPGFAGSVRVRAAVVAGGALSPIVLAAMAQAYVAYASPQLKWVSLSWRSLGVPAYLSFAFWEWVTCAVLSAYVAVLALAALATGRGTAAAPPDHRRG